MALTPPIEPMLAEARRQLPPDEALPRDWIAEQKSDGFRAILFARPDLAMVQSRQGSDLTGAFPDLATTAEGLIGGVTGTLASPATLLLARYGALGNLRMIARTIPLSTAVRRDLAQQLQRADADHPWQGRHFSAGWGTRGELNSTRYGLSWWPSSRQTPPSTRAATVTPSASCGCARTLLCSGYRPSAPDREATAAIR
ncbi:hypothetical protein ACH4E8_34235 [Streptomyces sp. NPDC017979]|uniref:hypothetical protein n=1 Tax=Streptomyces sp. NPDC017979 TaxID=3365024 RepID=UPI00379878F0